MMSVINMIMIINLIPVSLSAQYVLNYEFYSRESNIPYKMTEIWKSDTSWIYAYYGDDFVYHSESTDGKEIYISKKFNTGYNNIIEILKLPKENKMYIMEPVFWNDDNINISYDKYNLMNFQLIDSIVFLDSLRCQLARSTHRCKKYTIWYTMDIPIPSGPWKFHGLPGAIVKVKSDDEDIVMNLISVRNDNKKIEPVFNNKDIDINSLAHWKEQKDDMEKFLLKLKRRFDECKNCPKNVYSSFEMYLMECFD